MILIVEGTDLVGKSTLVNRIAADRGWSIARIRWALTGDVAAETHGMARATIELLARSSTSIILDRSYFSMWAYAWAYASDPSFMPALISRFDLVSSQRAAHLVVLTASAAELRRRWDEQPDEYHSLDIILQANEQFRLLAPLVPSSLPVLEIDTGECDAAAVYDLVNQELVDRGPCQPL